MFAYQKLTGLQEIYKPLQQRRPQGVYCFRIVQDSPSFREFIRPCFEAVRKNGVVIEGGIPAPDTRQVAYYTEMLGNTFQMDAAFIRDSLSKWLPRMSRTQLEAVSASIHHVLDSLQKQGKSPGMLKNAYIKFMCWLYYKFERVVGLLGHDTVPKILFEGNVTIYELLLLSVLSHAGCDIILLQFQGDAAYRKADPQSEYTQLFTLPGETPFPADFSMKKLRAIWQEEDGRRRLYGTLPEVQNCTNAWMEGKGLADFRKNPAERGNDPKLFYNGFCRLIGVEDKQNYQNELYQFQLELKQKQRPFLIFDERIPVPTPQEAACIPRKNYGRMEDLIQDLSNQIKIQDTQLRRLLVKSFVDVMLTEADRKGMMISPLSNLGICLLCWLTRYQEQLFPNWQMPQVSAVLWLGECRDEKEALFLRFLARLPVDVVLFVPQPGAPSYLEDSLLYDLHYDQTLELAHYPRHSSDLTLGTTAYHAERELDTLMYQDSGIYRNQQYAQANSLTLRTMYEEIFLLWGEEARFRPNFSVVGSEVNIPVLFAKISGVKDGDINKYWQDMRKLMTEDVFIVSRTPMINPLIPNPIRDQVPGFLSGSTLMRDRVKLSQAYQKNYGFLREEMQNHILDKLELLMSQQLILDSGEHNTMHTIIATVLNLPLDLIRRIQKFDFTKIPPKFLYVQVGERVVSQEDAIVAAFLNLIGFDVVFLVPTGYQSVEKYFRRPLIEEHQAGEYLYDVRVPNLQRMAEKAQKSAAKSKSGGFWNNIFKK